MAAPTANVAAEVSAACTGRAVRDPELIAGVGIKASFYHQLIGHLSVAAAEATPTIKLAVETMPSLAFSTAARSHPIRDQATLRVRVKTALSKSGP